MHIHACPTCLGFLAHLWQHVGLFAHVIAAPVRALWAGGREWFDPQCPHLCSSRAACEGCRNQALKGPRK